MGRSTHLVYLWSIPGLPCSNDKEYLSVHGASVDVLNMKNYLSERKSLVHIVTSLCATPRKNSCVQPQLLERPVIGLGNSKRILDTHVFVVWGE